MCDQFHLLHALVQFILVYDPALYDIGHETAQFRVAGVINTLFAEKILCNGVSQYRHVVRISGIGIGTVQDQAQPRRNSLFVADQADDRIVIADL